MISESFEDNPEVGSSTKSMEGSLISSKAILSLFSLRATATSLQLGQEIVLVEATGQKIELLRIVLKRLLKIKI